MGTSASCLFCKMIEKTVPVKYVHETPLTIAIEDIAPQSPTHLLIIPKMHVETVMDITEQDAEVWWAMMATAQQLAKDRNIVQPGFRLVFNCNPGAGQSVYPVHMHLLGGRPLTWPPG